MEKKDEMVIKTFRIQKSLLKDYEKACKKMGRTPSEDLRLMVQLRIAVTIPEKFKEIYELIKKENEK